MRSAPFAVLGLTLAVAGCAAASAGGPAASRPAIPAPAPAQITTADVAALAALLRAEDTRDPEVAPVVAYLGSPSSVVRARAAVALGGLRAREGVGPLVSALSDPDTAVAASAAFALGLIGDSSAVPALTPLLGTELDPARVTVSAEAAYALGRIRAEPGRAVLRSFLATVSPDDGRVAPVAESALLAIWRFPRDQEPDHVARWIGSGDPEIRWRAAYALVRRPDPNAAPLLRGLVDDPDARVRALAVRGLTAALADSAGLDPASTLPSVLGALDDPEYIVRINALGALGTYRDPRSRDALIAALDGPPHEVLAAAQSLGRLEAAAAEAGPRLEAMARDTSAQVALRAAALESLTRVAPPAGTAVALALAETPLWRLRATAGGVLGRAGHPEAQRLRRDPDGRVASATLQAMVGAAGDTLEPIRPILLESLRADDVGVRTAALGALARLADPATLPAMLDAYGAAAADPQNDAALAAIEALAALRSQTLQPGRTLFARFQRPADPIVHRLAVERFGDAAVRAWGPAVPIATGKSLDDYELTVRRTMAPVLQRRDSSTAVIRTESGTMTLRLFGAAAPLTVESFAALAASGFFDGQQWPRVVPNFVVQGGDPRGDTSGGPGYVIRDEIGRHRYGTGTLGMALSGPDTGGSQFFITHSPQPHLDGIYAIFGEVIAGQDVTERILPGERILSIRVEQ